MKLSFVSVIVVCLLANPCTFSQKQESPAAFRVRNVYIGLNADTRIVRRLTDRTISMFWNTASNRKEVDCLRSELDKTNLFKDIQILTRPSDVEGMYDLHVNLSYRKARPVYIVGSVRLDGFEHLNEASFKRRWADAHFKRSLSLLRDYPSFEAKIFESLSAASEGTIDTDSNNRPWLELRVNASGKLDVVIRPHFPSCDL